MNLRPNILLFVCDDLRFDALGCMGDPIVETPNLDRLARDGVCFNRCYLPGGSAPAVCMPSRAMIHTGRSLFHIEEEGRHIPVEHTTMGEYMRSAGYRSFHTGKWHNCRESLTRSFDDGDEIFLGGMGDPWNLPLFHFDSSGKYDARIPRIENPFHDKVVDHLAADHTGNGRHATTVFVDAGTRFLESRNDDTPFFLSIALTAPHDPRSAPREFHDLYDPDKIPLPTSFSAQHPHHTGFLSGVTRSGDRSIARDESLADIPRRPDEIREHLSDYYAMISHLDHEFGRLRGVLERNQEWKNTIVIFTADHGLALGQHGLMGKQSVHEHSIRVPLIMAGPGIPQGRSPEAMVMHFDIFRTLCDLLDLEMPETVEGRSLIPVWRGGNGRNSLFLTYARSIRGLIEHGYKLIEYAGPGGYRATQLFHLDTDPKETFDLARSPTHQSRIQSMREKLIETSLTNGDRESEIGRVFWEYWNR